MKDPFNARSLGDLQTLAWKIAEEKGFHGNTGEADQRSNATILALIHSEVSEALEADRKDDMNEYSEELADIVIRVLDHAETLDIDLEYEVKRKMAVNQDREYKHGKEY